MPAPTSITTEQLWTHELIVRAAALKPRLRRLLDAAGHPDFRPEKREAIRQAVEADQKATILAYRWN